MVFKWFSSNHVPHNRVSHIGPRLLLLVVVPWGCDFKGCDLKGYNLKGCDLKGCDAAHHEKPYSA